MSITIRDLLARVMMYRPDLDDTKGMFALLEAARRLGQQASIFRFPSIHNALTISKREVEVGVETQFKNTDGNFYRVENIAIADIPDGLTYGGPWDANANKPYLGEITDADMPALWRDINTADDPVPGMTSPTCFTYKNMIMMYGPATQPGVGLRTAIKRYYTDTNTWDSRVLWLNEPYTRSQTSTDVGGFSTSSAWRSHRASSMGTALIFGGLNVAQSPTPSVKSSSWVYDFELHSIGSGPDFSGISDVAFYQSYLYKMFDGKYLVYGIPADSGAIVPRLGIWDPVVNSSSYTTDIDFSLDIYGHPFQFFMCGPGRNAAGTLLYLSFTTGTSRISPIYDYAANTWITSKVLTLPGPTASGDYDLQTAVCFPYKDYIYFTGGSSSVGQPRNGFYKIDINANTVTKIGVFSSTLGVGRNGYIGKAIADSEDASMLIGNPANAIKFDPATDVITKYIAPQYPTRGGTYSFATDATSIYLFSGSVTYEKFQPAAPKNIRNYYTVSVHGTTTKGEYNQWDVGDVIYNDGTSWYRIRLDKFVYIPQVNDPGINRPSSSAEFGDGIPQSWWQRNSSVFFTVRPKKNYPVRFDVSYSPVGNEIATLPIPAECESVLTDGALSMLYMIPGSGMSAQLGQMADMRFKKGIATIRAIGMFGYGGTPSYTTGNPFGPQWNTVSINWMER